MEPRPYRRCFRCSRLVSRASSTFHAAARTCKFRGARPVCCPAVGVGVLDDPNVRPPPTSPRSAGPRPGAGCSRGILRGTRSCPQPPRRGRRPRRPFPSSIASPTTFLQSPSRGGAPPPPGVRSPPALWRRTGCGRRGPPAKGEPPARVPPLTPSCASLAMGYSARCGARPRAPPLDPARFFVKKRGKKLLNASLHPTQAPRPWGE